MDDLEDFWTGAPAPDKPELKIVYICISIGLVLLAGLMSGLTLGLMSMDQVDLEVLIRSGTPQEQKYAKRIAPVLRRPHLLLVTLLLVNAAAMEALPIFLDRLVDPITAIILSVTAVLFFGEIIPQALCTRYGLAIGAYSAWFVRVLIWVVGIVSYPISKVLDWLLGSEHGALFRRGQLKALVDIHSQTDGIGGGYLSVEEINIIRGALDMTEKKALVGMTPLDKVFMLSADAVLDFPTMRSVLGSGHSRVPVHRPGNKRDLLGLILVKELALIDPEDRIMVRDVKMRPLPMLRADTAMYDLLTLFQTGRSHMVVLTSPPRDLEHDDISAAASPPRTPPMQGGEQEKGLSVREIRAADTPPHRVNVEDDVTIVAPSDHKGLNGTNGVAEAIRQQAQDSVQSGSHQPVVDEPVGIITIEDVLEELLQQEIVDETDQFVDNLRLQKVNAALLLKNLPPHLRNLITRTQARAMPIAAAAKAVTRPVQDTPDQGLQGVRSANLDASDPPQQQQQQTRQLQRSRTGGRPLPPLQERLLPNHQDESSVRGDELV